MLGAPPRPAHREVGLGPHGTAQEMRTEAERYAAETGRGVEEVAAEALEEARENADQIGAG